MRHIPSRRAFALLTQRRFAHLPWTGATWAVDGNGRAYNTPTMGSEKLTNVEFTTDTTGWTAEASAVLTRRDYTSSPDIDPTGGSDNFGMEVANAGAGLSRAAQTATVGDHDWLRCAARVYAPSANTAANSAGFFTTNTTSGSVIPTVSSEDTWETVVETSRAQSASVALKLTRGSGTGDLGHFDVPSLRVITPSTLFAAVDGGGNNLTATAKIAEFLNHTQIGVVANLDSVSTPANGLIAHLDRNGIVRLVKFVAGVYTQLLSISVTFVAGSQVALRRPSGNIYQVWYGGAQVGTDQTVSDAGIISNTRYGLFSTYSGNLFTEFTLDGFVVPFGLPGA